MLPGQLYAVNRQWVRWERLRTGRPTEELEREFQENCAAVEAHNAEVLASRER